jgi:hypothetical protein
MSTFINNYPSMTYIDFYDVRLFMELAAGVNGRLNKNEQKTDSASAQVKKRKILVESAKKNSS